jgi:glycosyltransferase involved in cell wall biosynthesis
MGDCQLIPLRVLFLGAYPPPHGGVQTHLVALRDFLLRQGTSCEVINLTRYRRRTGDGVFYPRSALGVLWLLLRRRYDVAHLQVGGKLSRRWLLLGLVCSWIPGKKVVLTFHSGGYPSSPEGRAARPNSFKGMALRRLNGLIGVNQELVDFFQRLGVRAKNIRLIVPFAPAPEPAADLPPPLREFYDSHRPVIISVSGLEPEYDLPLQIRMLGDLRGVMPDAGLAIIGSGSIEVKLREEIAARPYWDHILLCGDVPHPVTLRAIADADVMIRTTLYDGDSISVRESLHLGVPVIASDTVFRPEGVILVPISDQEALHRAILETLGRPRVPNASPAADERNLQSVVEFYQELLNQKSSKPGR